MIALMGPASGGSVLTAEMMCVFTRYSCIRNSLRAVADFNIRPKRTWKNIRKKEGTIDLRIPASYLFSESDFHSHVHFSSDIVVGATVIS
jgi:hypothetical protein